MKVCSIAGHFRSHSEVVARTLTNLQQPAEAAAGALVQALKEGHKILAFGNGGSATQASHLAGELVGRFAATRQPFPAIALSSDPGTVTCISNDFGYERVFERQIEALAQAGDVAIGFTTSGRSLNVKLGLAMAQKRGAIAIALTGRAGLVDGSADHTLAVPSDSTAHVQEIHLMLLHFWCAYIDEVLGDVSGV
jgi:D-sedoheptulose 7-phosphate isomerase